MARDPYEVLGVSKDASQDDIKSSYRKIAKEHHPDLNPGDAEAETRFKEASQAYAILGDADTRAKFDRGEIDAAGQERPEAHFYRPHAESGDGGKYYRYETVGDFDDLGSVFEDLFGARARAGARGGPGGAGPGGFGGFRPGPQRGGDLRYNMEVDFLEAARGAKKRVTMPDGRTLDISIPKGLKDGQTLRLKGQGMAGVTAEGAADTALAGDALVTVAVRPHKVFERRGDDIHVTLPVTLREAVLGARITAPTIDGPVTLTVPEGATTGDVLRLKGRGVAGGNQLVTLEVQVPKDDEALKAFLRDNPDAGGGDPRQGMGG